MSQKTDQPWLATEGYVYGPRVYNIQEFAARERFCEGIFRTEEQLWRFLEKLYQRGVTWIHAAYRKTDRGMVPDGIILGLHRSDAPDVLSMITRGPTPDRVKVITDPSGEDEILVSWDRHCMKYNRVGSASRSANAVGTAAGAAKARAKKAAKAASRRSTGAKLVCRTVCRRADGTFKACR